MISKKNIFLGMFLLHCILVVCMEKEGHVYHVWSDTQFEQMVKDNKFDLEKGFSQIKINPLVVAKHLQETLYSDMPVTDKDCFYKNVQQMEKTKPEEYQTLATLISKSMYEKIKNVESNNKQMLEEMSKLSRAAAGNTNTELRRKLFKTQMKLTAAKWFVGGTLTASLSIIAALIIILNLKIAC